MLKPCKNSKCDLVWPDKTVFCGHTWHLQGGTCPRSCAFVSWYSTLCILLFNSYTINRFIPWVGEYHMKWTIHSSDEMTVKRDDIWTFIESWLSKFHIYVVHVMEIICLVNHLLQLLFLWSIAYFMLQDVFERHILKSLLISPYKYVSEGALKS